VVIGGSLDDPGDSELERLRQRVAELSLESSVEFLGAKGQELLPCYYALASAVIMPSDYESFGMVALEAMASGTPVIASEVGGLAFLVRDGETGFLVPVREPAVLADRIARLLSSAPLQQEMRAAAIALARRYSWPLVADQLLAAFTDMLAQRQVSRHKR
jgi:D-inositol-3-phosphate glycosyltransferase